MRALLWFFIILITYGSLYPFTFDPGAYHPALLAPLFDFHPGHTGRGDIVANLLLFVPFGFLAMLGYPALRPASRVVMILVLGFALAYLLQVAQLIVPGRTPSGSDAIWNLLGCAIGCALARLPLPRLFSALAPAGQWPPIPLALGLLWLAYNWAPFVPSIDLQLLKNNLKLIASSPELVWVCQKVVMWLVIFHFLHSAGGLWARERYYPLLVLATLVGGLFIVGHATTIEHVAGGVLAVPAWCMIRRRQRPAGLALLLAIALLATTFAPFDLRQAPATFRWIPFSGALDGNMLINVMATFSKLVMYASLTWLLVEAGMALRNASLAVAAALLVSEWLQVYFQGPTPEITDPLLALIAGATLHAYRSAASVHAPYAAARDVAPAQKQEQEQEQGEPILQLNLHYYQAAFVEDCAASLGWNREQLCEALLAAASDNPQSSAAASALRHMTLGPDVLAREPRWVVLPVTLSTRASAQLKALASTGERSESRTLRHLIDAQITCLSNA